MGSGLSHFVVVVVDVEVPELGLVPSVALIVGRERRSHRGHPRLLMLSNNELSIGFDVHEGMFALLQSRPFGEGHAVAIFFAVDVTASGEVSPVAPDPISYLVSHVAGFTDLITGEEMEQSENIRIVEMRRS